MVDIVGITHLQNSFSGAAQGSPTQSSGLSSNFDFSGIDLGGLNIGEFGQQIMDQISEFLGPLIEQIKAAFSGLSENGFGLGSLTDIFQTSAADADAPAADASLQADAVQTPQRVATVSGLAGGPTS